MGIAIDPADGDLLVIDLEDQTVSRWNEDGTPAEFSALGGNVIDGAGGADETPQGEILSTEVETEREVQVAVAPPGAAGGTAGNIYVTDAFNEVLDVFAPSGEYLGQISAGYSCGVAVAANGDVYVGDYYEGVHKLVPSAPATFSETSNSPFPMPTLCQVAAGGGPTAGFVFAAGYNGPVTKIDSDGAQEGETKYTVSPGGMVAVDPATGHVYVTGGQDASEVGKYDASGADSASLISSLDLGSQVFGFAVDGSGPSLYLTRFATANVEVYDKVATPPPPPTVTIAEPEDVSATGATFAGIVDPNGFQSEWRFEYRKLGTAAWTSSPLGDAGAGDAPVPVSFEATGLASGATYEVRLLATNEGGTATSPAPNPLFSTGTTPPTIVEQRPIDATQSAVTLQARINPNGLPTTYHFEFGADTSYGTRIPADHELFVGSGTEPVIVSANRGGLQEKSVYWFRLVATNSKGIAVGPDQRLETLNEHGLPNNRAFELVTPADKGSSGSVADDLSVQQSTQASGDGESLMYPLTNGLDGSTAGGWLRQRAERTDSGWLSTQISAPSLVPPPGSQNDQEKPSYFHFASPEVDCGFLESYNPLTEDTPQVGVELGMTNLYRWGADGDYELVTNRLPLNPEQESITAFYQKVDASDDCSRVFFTSSYELIADASGLYEWDEGTLRDAGLLPNGEAGAGAVLGGEVDGRGTARWNAVSPDGSRIFFTAISEDSGKPAVFMREDDPSCDPLPAPCAVEISASETAVPTNGARFEAASADGNRVFFRANYGIADTSSDGLPDGACGPLNSETEFNSNPKLEEKPCDLYAYDVESEELTDLSADANLADAGVGAQIQGAVAVDEDGSHVYFAALGQLIPGEGRTYAENTAGFGSANVYLAREGQPLSYVTTLAEHGLASGGGQTGDLLGPGQSGFGPGAALMRRSGKWVANTTLDGGELLFVSSLNLTGWESGGTDKYAVYLYSADTDRLACVSCRPDGLESIALPFGWKLGQPAQSSWLLAGPDQSNGNRPRSLSEDGSRVFFTSPDVLAPGAEAGKRNVYEWQEGQVFLLAVAEGAGLRGLAGHHGSSASGDDVFIATGERLAPQDTDSLSDVYDVRVDGGFPEVVQPPDCQVDEAVPLVPSQIYCQGDPSPQPPAPGPASAGFQGPGNPPEGKPRPRRCSKGKVRRRGKCVKRKNRGAPRKQNRAAKSNRGGAR